MAGTRCNLHRLFSTLLLASTLSLFVVNFYGFVLEVGEDPNPQRRSARDRGKSEDQGAEKSLSVEEKALLVAHSGKDQTPIQTQGQSEVQAQAQQPSEPQARVLQPPPLQTRVPEPPKPLTTPKKVPEPPEPLTMPKKVPEPPEPLTTPKKVPEPPLTTPKKVPEQPPAPQTEPPKTPGKGSESPGLPTSANQTQLAELQMNGPKPATPQPEAPVEWINKSSKCLPLPGKVHVVPIPQEDCTEPHVVMHAGGQLGNKMCQYISLYLLRHIFGVRVSITPHMKEVLSRYFVNVSLPIQDPECFTKNTLRIMYDDLYLQLQSRAASKSPPDGSGVVQGRLMDESYYIYHHPCPRDVILAHRSLVRRVLTFKEEVLQQARANLQEALDRIHWPFPRDNTTVVSVHVRRRDYTAYILKHYNLSQLDEIYFQRAFRHFRSRVVNPVFVVVSDDHSWCHRVLEGGDVVVAGSQKDPVNDIALLSLGDHNVISYGTFSFMGATLARGDVAHPMNNNDKYSHFNCVDNPAIRPINRDADDSGGV